MEVTDKDYSNYEEFTIRARGQNAQGNWYYRLDDETGQPYQGDSWFPQAQLAYPF